MIDILGSISSIIGLLVALLGFTLTIYHVHKTKWTAQRAYDTAKEVKEDIKTVDTITQLSSAIAIMEEIKRLHRNKAWEILLDRYSSLRKRLITIKKSYPSLSHDYEKKLTNAIMHFSTIEAYIDEAVCKKFEPKNIHETNKIIAKQIDIIQEILEEIQNLDLIKL